MPSPRKICPFLLPTLFVSASPSEARAAEPTSEIPKVELTPRGPTTTFPLDQSFYVTGEVPKGEKEHEYSEVYALFVRYWWGPWSLPPSGRAPRSCSDVEAALAGDINFDGVRSSSSEVEEIWKPRDSKHYKWLKNSGEVLVATGGVDANGQFQALANDPSFFHHGARYCVFVYGASRRTTEAVRDDFIAGLREDVAGCFDLKTVEEQGDCKLSKSADAIVRFERALGIVMDEGVPEAVAEKLKNEVAGAFLSVLDATQEVVGLRGSWDKIGLSRPGDLVNAEFIELGLDGNTAHPDADFARLLLELLARNGTVLRDKKDVQGKPVAVFFLPKEFEVHAVQLIEGKDGQIEVIKLWGPKQSDRAFHRLELPLSKLRYPESGSLSLEDVRSMAAGERPPGLEAVEAISVSFVQTKNENLDIMKKLPQVKTARESVEARQSLFKRVAQVRDNTSPQTADRYLSDWLGSLCKDPDAAGKACDVNEMSGLLKQTGEELQRLESGLETLGGSVEGLIVETDQYVSRKLELSPEISPTLSLSPDAYFDHYVSGYLGVSVSQYQSGEVAILPVAGAHLFLWPNELRQPMWSNGVSDLRRLIGLEYGVRLGSGNFGPDGRYRGVGGGSLPVMLLGGLLQPLPYVFVSVGAMFSSYQRSVVAQERPQTRVGWYVGLTIDGNLAGVIRSLIGNKGARTLGTPN